MKTQRVLILVDLQNDFIPGGPLAVPNGDEVIPVANKMIESFANDLVVFTLDWHPANHCSFKIWPIHCVQDTPGAELHKDLVKRGINIYKGMNINIDSHGAFWDNSHTNETGLYDYIKMCCRFSDTTELYIMGLATDYCVKFTVLDALEYPEFKVFVIEDGCRGITSESTNVAIEEMKAKGAVFIKSSAI